jgi:5'-methylthioadenosine phosphorylase
MPNADLLLLIAVLLPPKALDDFGTVIEERLMQTPFGDFGPLALRSSKSMPPVWVAPYSGMPTRTDPRATVYAANQLGLKRILGWDSGIAINPVLMRGQPVIADDFIDWTWREPNTFTNDTIRDRRMERKLQTPRFCPQMRAALQKMLPIAPGVTCLGVDDLRRETPAEARMFRLWGADVLGENLVPEVLLAKELGLCFAGLITIDNHSADQTLLTPHGELRLGLEMVMQVLPDCIRYLDMLPECDCGQH